MTDYIALWRDEYTVHSYEVDPEGHLSFPALCNYIQNTAFNHAHHLRLGYQDMKERDLTWVLSRLTVKVLEPARLNQRLIVETWVKKVTRFSTVRDLLVADADGKPLVQVSTYWVIIGLTTRRPHKLDAVPEGLTVVPGKEALVSDFRDFGTPSREGRGARRRVYHSDLDLNRHVNNVNTVRWILDSQSSMAAANYGVCDFRAAFLSEAFCGEEVAVYSEAAEDEDRAFLSAVVRVKTEEEVCRARVRWGEWGD